LFPELGVPATREIFTQQLQNLIRKFEADKEHYLSKAYSEAQARIDFITPFFKALGWDVENEAGLPHGQRDVIVERAEEGLRPDYNFRIGGQTKFFVEAKAPSEPLDAARHILQAKDYAWSTNTVQFVVLTDFEEFRFYDATVKPDERKPDEGLLLPLKYGEYVAKAEKLWEFSKERVAAGSLDSMLPRDRRTQRLRIPPDESFLEDMTGWREELARNVFKNNPGLTAKQLNEVVQRLLDRIVFIRIAEDRRIIEKNQLRDAVEYWQARGGKFHLFDWLNDLFHRINEDFNGEIFKPHLSETIKIDSEVLAKIIERLYPPKSPYRFDVIGVELLGSIYERYLGKTIRPTAKTVRVEEKPEVRKAGGVYYTPKYIVDYIVKNTVGKVIEGKTPKQIERIRILDPACGSGSFLIGAFQYLIDYHVRYFTAHPKEAHIHPLFPDLIPDGNGGHRLSVRLKARILRRNLFGVDIDPQAVEITMMSLYLKALEGEKSQLPPKQSLLPELKYNIICGNSLIGPDIFDQGTLFADEERDRINAFDWYADHGVRELAPAFEGGGKPPHSKPAVIDRRYSPAPATMSDVMRQGGFDCVIGNPPYVRQESLADFKDYFEKHYDSFDGMADLYVYFMEKGIRVLKEGGYYSIIVSSSFLRTTFAENLRRFLKKSAAVLRIVDFGGLAVFTNAKDTYVCVPLLAKLSQPARIEICRVNTLDFDNLDAVVSRQRYLVLHESLTDGAWSMRNSVETALFDKIKKRGQPLGKYVDDRMFYGIKTGLNEAFELSADQARKIISASKRSRCLIKPILGGEDIRRYFVRPVGKFWIVVPSGWTRQQMRAGKVVGSISENQAWTWFSKRHKAIAAYLRKFEPACRKRQDQGEFWWELRPCDYYEYFESPKIVFPDICKGPRFFLDRDAFYLANTAYCLGVDDLYLLGILNSKVFWFSIGNISIPFGIRAGEYRYRLIYQYMEKVPIRTINFSEPADKARHDRMVALVERMLEQNKQKHSGKLAPSELERLDRDITSTDAAIDNLVYELYGITEEEQRIIEGD
jgi:type I restriction-modification system DNA methylase subunit